MMKLICVRSNKKLLKGQTYECDYINTTMGSLGRFRNNIVNIVGFGRYSTSGFRMEDDSIIPLDYTFDNRAKFTPIFLQDINVGDWVICNTNSYKSLIFGQRYQIEEVIKSREVNWSSRHKMKLKGSKRFIDFGYNFKLLSKDESRDISLSALLDNKVLDGEVGKIDDRDKMLMLMLSKSIIDPNRHKLSIVEWAIEKYGKCGINEDDFKTLLNKKLKTILESL